MNFESLRHEISHHVHAAREPVSPKLLMEACKLVEDPRQLSNALYNMCQAEQLVRHAAPAGSGDGVRWCYGPGKIKLGATPPQNDAGGGDRPARRPRKQVGKKRRKERAMQPRKAAPKGARKAPLKRVARAHQRPGSARWALTSDGAFLLLDNGTEIPQPAARALIDFVRRLDGGEA